MASLETAGLQPARFSRSRTLAFRFNRVCLLHNVFDDDANLFLPQITQRPALCIAICQRLCLDNFMAPRAGLEPTSSGLESDILATELSRHKLNRFQTSRTDHSRLFDIET